MVPWWALAVLVFGANFTLWGMLGICRLSEAGAARLTGLLRRRRGARSRRTVALPGGPGWRVLVAGDSPGKAVESKRARSLTVGDVAVLIPAHNEELVIEESLAAIMALVPCANIHVVSDGSTDRTVELAAAAGARVMTTPKNMGKAGALELAIRKFGLTEKYAAVMLLDADTRVEPGYFSAALPLFDNPRIAAVAGCVRTQWDRKLSPLGNLLVAHRTRIYSVAQRVLKMGQTWMRTNATHIVPGFASLYRTSVLPKIDMNPPGLVIEDFNMTFELYQRHLGKVGFTMSAVAVTQDPDNFHDYVRQTRRWAVGLWQTVWRHAPRPNLFSLMLLVLLLELVVSSLLFLLLPVIVLVLGTGDLFSDSLAWPPFGALHREVATRVDLHNVLIGVVLPDCAITCLTASVERRARLLLCGFLFLPLRVIDAAIALYAVPVALFTTSTGRWRSPARRAGEAVPIERKVKSSA
jgi:glycosyltransferase involved in cell wall biosynthesis